MNSTSTLNRRTEPEVGQVGPPTETQNSWPQDWARLWPGIDPATEKAAEPIVQEIVGELDRSSVPERLAGYKSESPGQ